MKSASLTTSFSVLSKIWSTLTVSVAATIRKSSQTTRERAMLQHRGRHVRAAQRLGAAGAGKVLGLLLLEDLHGVVDRDDADQAVLGVDDRQGQQVGLADQARGLLLVGVDAGRVDLGVHQVADQRGGIGQDEVSQAQRSDQAAVVVGDRQRVDRLGRSADAAQPIERLARRSSRRGGWRPRAT